MGVGKRDRYTLIQQWLKACKWYAVVGGILFGTSIALFFYAINTCFELYLHAPRSLELDPLFILFLLMAFIMAFIGMLLIGYWNGANEAVKKMKEIEKEELLLR